MNTRVTVILVVLAILVILPFVIHPPSAKPSHDRAAVPAFSGQVLAARTKSAGCQVNGALQDSACTPGAIFAGATKDAICTPGYSKSVRNVPTTEKQEVYTEYGIARHPPGQYEVDHLVSLELGGSNDVSNLWPEAANPNPGFHQKDAVENYLHNQVCNGAISLLQAQQQIAGNWLSIYNSLSPSAPK
jgi:hypothetical protein